MDLETLQSFFFWCLIINIGIYAFTAIAVVTMRSLICKIHHRLFGLDEEAVMKSILNYIATYKLLITVFNFVPWIAILIIK